MSFIPNYNNQFSNNSLKNEIEKLKKEIIRLNNENSLLKNENQSLKNENKNLKNEVSIKNADLNKYMLKINELNNTLTDKNNEISNLNYKINNLKLDNNPENEFIRRGEILTFHFKSINGKVDMPYSCKSSDIFVDIEKMLYNDYSEYKDLNTYFTVNGVVVKRFRNFLENNIQNKDKIFLNIYKIYE